MAPYVAAVVSRSDLRQWALDIGADKDAGVLAKDPTAILSLLGQAMSDPSLVYAAARKKRKKPAKKDPPELPDDLGEDVPSHIDENGCYQASCVGCGSRSCCQTVCVHGGSGPCEPCPVV